jgi:ubiquinone/menaquinone biosynthesis C-methylase UbiE
MSISADSIMFDLWSASYDRPGLQQTTYRPVHDAILERISGLAPAVVVDLGCGTGQLTRRLVDAFPSATIVGADLSAGMLERALAAETDAGQPLVANYTRANAERLPLAEASADIVVCTESFHWYDDQPAALAGLHRIIRPGGRLLIASVAALTGFGEDALRQTSSLAGRPIRAVPKRKMKRMIEDAGFEVTDQGRILRLGFVPWPVLTEAVRH